MGRIIKMTDAGYPVEIKMVDGEQVEIVDIDAMTEDQFKKWCADSGTEWFQRFSIHVKV